MLKVTALLFLSGIVSTSVHAQARQAVNPLEGYRCMSLNVETGYLYSHRTAGVPEYAAPSLSSQVVNPIAPSVVIVRDSSGRDGFLEALQPNRTRVWIEAKFLRPWSNPYAPSARCRPAVMSDGSIGTGS